MRAATHDKHPACKDINLDRAGGWGAPIMSRASVILSSSSGQMSGHEVNPKYSSAQLPRRSRSLNGLPSWSSSWNGPPTMAFPTTASGCAPPTHGHDMSTQVSVVFGECCELQWRRRP